MTEVCVVGIGSAHGADCAGWSAIEALRHAGLSTRFPPGRVALRQCKVPAQLYVEVAGSRCVIVIDVLPGASTAVQWLSTDELRNYSGLVSVHGIGVGEMLALLDSLVEPPPQVRVLALGVDAGGDETVVAEFLRLHLQALSSCIEQAIGECFSSGL